MPRSTRTPSTSRLPPRTRASRPEPLGAAVSRRSMERWMVHATGAPAVLIERLWSDPDGALADGRMLKDGDRCTVVRIDPPHHDRADAAPPVKPDAAADLASDTSPHASTTTAANAASIASLRPDAGGFVLKRYNLKDRLHTSVHLFLRSRARWSWLNGRRLASAGLPTPLPRACVEERRAGVLRGRSYLLTDFIEGEPLLDLALSGAIRGDALADIARQFARMWQTLGQLRAGHGDMKASNFIVDAAGKLWLIDLDGLRIHRTATLLRRERRNDLSRFMRNWRERPEVAAVFRARIGTG